MAKKSKSNKVAVPDGKGGFTDPSALHDYPVCPVCTLIFESGDAIVNLITEVHPKTIMTSPAHMSCVLAVAKGRIMAEESKEVHTDEEPEGDTG